jgi:hypothetical protein
MPENEWTWLALALARVGARDALRRLQRAWLEGTLRLRGVKTSASDEARELVEIPAHEAGRLRLDCVRNQLLWGSVRRHVTEYRSVQARTADVERLAQETREIRLNPGREPGPAPRADEIEKRRRGGRASAKKRREKARLWKDWVAAQAPPMRLKHEGWTQEDLADKLIERATEEKVEIAERKTVVAEISALEAAGRLPRRKRS